MKRFILVYFIFHFSAFNLLWGQPLKSPKGKLSSPFAACEHQLIISEDSYLQNKKIWDVIEAKCNTKISLATDVGITSFNPLQDGVKYLEFAERVAKKVKANLIKSRSYADCSASCFKGAQNCFSAKDLKEKQIIKCEDRKKEITEAMKLYSRKIRMELALSQDAPGLTNVNIQNVLSISKDNKNKLINTNLRDFEIGTPNPVGRTELTARELKEAQRRLDREILQLETEYKNKGYKNYSDWMSIKLVERFDEHQANYRKLIYEDAPIFGVISGPAKFDEKNDPVWSDKQVADSFLKLSDNALSTEEKVDWSIQNGKLEFSRANAEALKKWVTSFDSKRKDTNDLLVYMGMKNVVEEVLQEDPSSCGIATAMDARLKSKELQNNGVILAVSVSTTLIGKLGGGSFGVLKALGGAEIAKVTGLAVGATYLGDNFRKFNLKTTEAQTSSGLGKENDGVAIQSAQEVERARENLKTALTFSTIDVHTGLTIGKKVYSSIAPLAKNTGLAKTMVTRKPIAGADHLGEVVKALTPYNFPQSMRLRKYKNAASEEYVMYEKVVSTSQGKVIQSRELSIDPLTGAIDANFPSGKELLEDLIKEKQGKATLAFIDVNNLGYVNNNFDKGRIAGDKYLASIANAITKATEGKAQLFKLGGDEYGVIIHEADPKSAKSVLQKIIDACYSKEVHSIFKENTVARAEAVRKSRVFGADGEKVPLDSETIKNITAYSPYSKEGISMGAVTIKNDDSFEALMAAAESQSIAQKILIKTELNISTKKYGGTDAIPGARPNLLYKPSAQLPVSTGTVSGSSGLRLSEQTKITSVKKYATDEVVSEKYRFGDISIVEHKMADGSPVLKYNRYFDASKGTREYVTRELVVNSKSGLIDGTHESGKYVLGHLTQGENAVIKNRGFLWINAENLGKINYFHNGMANGDKLLAATARTIQKELSAGGVPIKMQGSEFIILQEGLSKEKISTLMSKLHTALINDPEIKKIYSDQIVYLQSELKKLGSAVVNAENSKRAAEVKESLKAVSVLKPEFSIEGLMLSKKDTLESALKNTKGMNYEKRR